MLQLPPGNQSPCKIYVVKVGKKMAKSLTVRYPAQFYFQGKNPDPENPGKIRIPNLRFWMSETKKGQQKVVFYGVI